MMALSLTDSTNERLVANSRLERADQRSPVLQGQGQLPREDKDRQNPGEPPPIPGDMDLDGRDNGRGQDQIEHQGQDQGQDQDQDEDQGQGRGQDEDQGLHEVLPISLRELRPPNPINHQAHQLALQDPEQRHRIGLFARLGMLLPPPHPRGPQGPGQR
jgi:uncharacterized sporulation protein YeaH/YhbH (DUF444 family)